MSSSAQFCCQQRPVCCSKAQLVPHMPWWVFQMSQEARFPLETPQDERPRTLGMLSWHVVCEMGSLNSRSNTNRTPPNLQFRKQLQICLNLLDKMAIFIWKMCPACLGLNTWEGLMKTGSRKRKKNKQRLVKASNEGKHVIFNYF